MAQAKPFAALSSSLLARPGQAKPAMRAQGFGGYAAHEDLGWNDMGQAQSAAPSATQTAAESATPPAAATPPVAAPIAPEPVPPVLVERARLAGRVATKPAPASAPTPSRRAAFTVRLDPERHLRLRLASAVAGRSSQHLMVAALDAFLDTQPQVDMLARQLPTEANARSPEEKSR